MLPLVRYKKVAWLSTGEVRRVLLAAVLSKAPRVVVFDKPYDGLDAPSRANLRMILSQVRDKYEVPPIFISSSYIHKIRRRPWVACVKGWTFPTLPNCITTLDHNE